MQGLFSIRQLLPRLHVGNISGEANIPIDSLLGVPYSPGDYHRCRLQGACSTKTKLIVDNCRVNVYNKSTTVTSSLIATP